MVGYEARAIGSAKLGEADQLFCDAWSKETFWGERPADSPTIAQAINGKRPLLCAKCRRCDTQSMVDLRRLVRPPQTHVISLEPALFCEACSGASRKYRVRADILGLMGDPTDPEDSAIEKP